MLGALNSPATPAPVRPKPPPRPTPVQSDVQAIVKGMEQARSSPKAGYQEDMPKSETPRDLPVPAEPPDGGD